MAATKVAVGNTNMTVATTNHGKLSYSAAANCAQWITKARVAEPTALHTVGLGDDLHSDPIDARKIIAGEASGANEATERSENVSFTGWI